MDSQDAFTTDTTGLPEASSPSVVSLHDGDSFDLDIRPVRKKIGDAEVRMLGYNGSIPGPTMQVDQGSQITVNVRNDGDVDATVHWHGLQAREPLRRGARRDAGADRARGHVLLQAAVSRSRALLVPPAHPRGLRPGDGPVRTHSGRALRPLLLATRRPAADHHPGRRPDRGRQDGALQPLGAELRGDGPLRQRHAHKRREQFLW